MEYYQISDAISKQRSMHCFPHKLSYGIANYHGHSYKKVGRKHSKWIPQFSLVITNEKPVKIFSTVWFYEK